MKFKKAALVLPILLGSVGCDQVTKIAAREHLQGAGTFSYLGDTFRLVYIENHGAFLGMGASLPEPVRQLIFIVMVAIFLIGFLVWILRSSIISTSALLAASLIVGGGIGNLIDRILFSGGVTDFLNMGIGSLRTGIFNIADVWIVAGALLLIISPEMRGTVKEAEPDADEPPEPLAQ